MAKVYNNDNSFLVIEMNGYEASSLNFGWHEAGDLNIIVCGGCNEEISKKDIYYIAAINEVMCKDCLEDTLKNMSHYNDEDSIKYEVNHFNIIAQKLGMSEKAGFTPDGKIIIIP